MIEQMKEDMVTPAGTLIAVQRLKDGEIRKQSLSACGRLIEANLLVTGVIGAALLRVSGRISRDRLEDRAQELGALLASFVIGIDITERAISGGLYLQASALLRQEMEMLAAIHEVQQGTRKNGNTPNVKSLELSIRRLYSDLSAAAHLAKDHIVAAATETEKTLEHAPKDTIMRRYFPEFDGDLARKMYTLHTFLMMHIANHMDDYFEELYGDGLTDDEGRCLEAALELMIEEKCIERDA